MNNELNTGGAAFPVPIIVAGSVNDSEEALKDLSKVMGKAAGMTLRDYYIGQALANPEIMKFVNQMQKEQCRTWPPVLAEMCDMAATAILNLREERT